MNEFGRARGVKRVGLLVSVFGCLVAVLSGLMSVWLVASSKRDGWIVLQLVGLGVFFVGWLLRRSAKSA